MNKIIYYIDVLLAHNVSEEFTYKHETIEKPRVGMIVLAPLRSGEKIGVITKVNSVLNDSKIKLKFIKEISPEYRLNSKMIKFLNWVSNYNLIDRGLVLKMILSHSKFYFRKKKTKENDLLRNVSIPKGIEVDNINLEQAKFLCSLPKILGQNPDTGKDITLNSGRFGPYLKCENKSARLENVEEIFTIGINRAITMIAEAKPGRISSSMIKDLGEHPEDKKPVRIMKGQYGPYIKYKSLNATIPEEKDPNDLTMEEALILIEKRKEYDKTKKKGRKK